MISHNSLPTSAALRSVFWAQNNRLLKEILLILTGVLLLAFTAHLSIPLRPVPLTFQSASVILFSMCVGSRLGTFTIAAYLIAGIVGLPVFADAPLTASFFGPTSGYLIGFLPAAYVAGLLAQQGFAKTLWQSFIAACLSALIIFAFGVSVLALFTSWHDAIRFGLLPFVISEPIKLFAAASIIPLFWKKI